MGRQRTALITGGTGSLGFRTAQALLAAGDWRVIITGRTGVDRTVARLGVNAVGRSLDLGSLAAVRSFAAGLSPLDAIVCNAGAMIASGLSYTADGIEKTFGVNHLAHFLLVRQLLGSMPAPGRVVFVSSATHDPRRRTGFPPPDFSRARELAFPAGGRSAGRADRVDVERTGGAESTARAGKRRYAASKLCNVLCAYEFARRVPAGTATFNVVDPGQMPGTGLARDLNPVQQFAWRHVMPALRLVPGINRHSPAQSAGVIARLVLDPGLSGATGRYFSNGRDVRSSVDSYDAAMAKDLWDTSVALTSAEVHEQRRHPA